MATTFLPFSAAPASLAEEMTQASGLSPLNIQCDEEIVEVTDYRPKTNFSDGDSNASDTIDNDLSDLENAIHDDMSRTLPYPVGRTYSSSDSERSVEEDEDFNDSDDDFPGIDYATVDQSGFDELMRFGMYEPGGEPVQGIHIEPQPSASNVDLPAIDYATVDENGLDELMRFGLYEPGDEPVHGVFIEPQQEKCDTDLSNSTEEKPLTAFDEAVGKVDASRSRIKQIMSLMTWINDDSHTDDDASPRPCDNHNAIPRPCDNHNAIHRSPSWSSDGSTVVLYEGPRILSHVLDSGDIETLLDDEDDRTDVETLDGGDIVTLDSEYDFDDENGSERCYGEIETLDDTDDNSVRMLDAIFNDSETTTCHGFKTGSSSCQEIEGPSTKTADASHPKESTDETNHSGTDISFACEKSSPNRRRRSREDTRRTRDSAKKVSKLKKFRRMIKSCFTRWNK